MKKPVFYDFGITAQEYEQAIKDRAHFMEANLEILSWLKMLLSVLLTSILAWILMKFCPNRNMNLTIIFFVFWPVSTMLVCYLVEIPDRKRLKEFSKPIYQKVQCYEDAVKHYQQKCETYWKSLRGLELEKALAKLYYEMGYTVQTTKSSGDEGVDLFLYKGEKKIVVQCKGHKNPIGVSVIRDLYGAMLHFKADIAILVCPVGFSVGIKRFAKDKPIQLISATDLVNIINNTVSQKI
jgi:hypothetical protein